MILKVPAGAKIFLGAPARGMDPWVVRSLAETVAAVPDVAEAHIPQCYIPGVMECPAQVLVVVIRNSIAIEPTLAAVTSRIERLLPTAGHLDIWPLLSASSLLSAVRDAGCRIFERYPQAGPAPSAPV
jgi:hypothetical protein